jgi:NADH dehydrogenase [ubiquinone] 1 alpha subcomplex assembly factor 7
MKLFNQGSIPLDRFINYALYDKEIGYYMSHDPFGSKGDFVTAPTISRLFSEIIGIWVITFWQSIGSPKKFNLIELGAGNAEMMKIMIETFRNFPDFFNSCEIKIHEKSNHLIQVQKKKLNFKKINWIKDFKKIEKSPSIFIANEFFDALPIKQFFKKKDQWFERYVDFKNSESFEFIDKKFDMKNFEKKNKFNISNNQKIIEYSPSAIKYLKLISNIIKKNNGGLLIIDYGYNDLKMKNTLQAISKHKHVNILENVGKADITYNLSFKLIKQMINNLENLNTIITNQRKFLTNMGILKRAEIISKKETFSKKADIFYRLKRLIDENEMGNLFKVMLIKKKNNKFKTGF